MKLTIQEIHYYNKLVTKNKIENYILCPFNPKDIVVLKVNEDYEPLFECISCDSIFKLNDYAKINIKSIIDKYSKL
jgi:hypothetical protein